MRACSNNGWLAWACVLLAAWVAGACTPGHCGSDAECASYERCFSGFCVARIGPGAGADVQLSDLSASPLIAGSCARPEAGQLVLNEVLAAPESLDDVNGDGLASTHDDEFVEIVNVAPHAVELEGITLLTNQRVKHDFGSFCLPSEHAIVVFSGGGTRWLGDGVTVVVATRNVSIANDGGSLQLVDRNGIVLDRFSYGRAPGISYTRFPDKWGPPQRHDGIPSARGRRFSPGRCADGGSFPICVTTVLRLSADVDLDLGPVSSDSAD